MKYFMQSISTSFFITFVLGPGNLIVVVNSMRVRSIVAKNVFNVFILNQKR